MEKKKRPNKEQYIPRDISWLKFNDRVLNEAVDTVNPMLERLKFLAIYVNNLDEYYMVRVASLKNVIESKYGAMDKFGYYPQELLKEVKERSRVSMNKLMGIYKGFVEKELKKNEIYIRKIVELNKEQKKFVSDYFDTTIYPIITPLAVDPGHPFPVLPSKTMAFSIHVKKKEESNLVILPVPRNIPRVMRLPSKKGVHEFILIEEIMRVYLKALFKGFKVKETALFRVIRDSELSVDEETAANILKAIEGEVRKRAVAKPVYLEVEEKISEELLTMLCDGMKFPKEEVMAIDGDLDLTYLFRLVGLIDEPKWCYEPFAPAKPEYDNIFDFIKAGVFMLHVPYQSFDPTVELIEEAAKDPHVLAIKMTLYRTNKDSQIISSLKEAASNGKQVTILVEIKARFDEENNIRWTRELEEAGCHVIYGIPGMKVHSKMTLVVREEEGRIQRYVHLATGNYNEATARVYTDLGYFTANEDFAGDISDLFNVITGLTQPSVTDRIISAPKDMRNYILSLMDAEIKYHKKSKNGMIRAKMNSLEDKAVIDKLYEASQAGVRVRIIVRGICCLLPGVKGISENIKVKSIVGRFLEHTRIFLFNNNDNPRVFLSSADWMKRNFDGRIEVMFEIYNQKLKEHLIEILGLCWKDTLKTWILKSDGEYEKYPGKKDELNVQEHLIKYYGR